MRHALLMPLLFAALLLNAQRNVDSLVERLHIAKDNDDPEALARELTRPFSTDSEKVRAIFYWVTENIAYDKKLLENGFPILYNEDQYYDFMVLRTLQKRKGVCSQYAMLFAELCKYAHIKCQVIEGWGLGTPYNPLRILVEEVSNHAWNAVRINGRWYLLDATWASGNVATKRQWTKGKRNDLYYLTDPNLFVLTHHPEEKEWQLLDQPLNMWHFIGKARQHRKLANGPVMPRLVKN